jgi:hypothetical protein
MAAVLKTAGGEKIRLILPLKGNTEPELKSR